MRRMYGACLYSSRTCPFGPGALADLIFRSAKVSSCIVKGEFISSLWGKGAVTGTGDPVLKTRLCPQDSPRKYLLWLISKRVCLFIVESSCSGLNGRTNGAYMIPLLDVSTMEVGLQTFRDKNLLIFTSRFLNTLTVTLSLFKICNTHEIASLRLSGGYLPISKASLRQAGARE